MFCSACGSRIPDGAKFCPACSGQAEKAAPQKTAPKGNLIALLRYAPTKLSALIALILTVLCLGVMILSGHMCAKTTIEKLPAVSLVLNATGIKAEFMETKSELQQAVGEIEAGFIQYEKLLRRELTVEQFDTLQEMVKIAKDCGEDISVKNVRKFIKQAQEFMDKLDRPLSYYEESYGMDMDLTEMYATVNAAEIVLDVASYALTFCVVVCLLFSVLGGIFRKKGLVIAGMILHLLYCLILAGVLFMALSLALHIAMLVFLGQISKKCELTANPA